MEAVRTRRVKEDRFVPVTADDKVPVLEKTVTERAARSSSQGLSPLRYTSEEQRISASTLFAEEIQVGDSLILTSTIIWWQGFSQRINQSHKHITRPS